MKKKIFFIITKEKKKKSRKKKKVLKANSSILTIRKRKKIEMTGVHEITARARVIQNKRSYSQVPYGLSLTQY